MACTWGLQISGALTSAPLLFLDAVLPLREGGGWGWGGGGGGGGGRVGGMV